MNRISIPIVFGMACLLFIAVAACFQAGEEDALFTEPCVPFPGSDVDPCERRNSFSVGVSAHYWPESFPGRPFNTYDEMKRLSALCPNGLCTPQFYIRATIIPGSARCLRAEAVIVQDDQGHIAGAQFFTPRDRYLRWDCFVDATVHEYLNGTGPRRLPINLRTIFLDPWETSPELIDSYARGVSWDYEGYEFIIPLARDRNLAVGEWSKVPNGLWDVQKTDDGEVFVVSWWTTVAPEWRSDYEMSLDDFRDMTRDGMARYFRETDGRLGTGGINPLVATDASRDGLLGVLTELGAFTVADVTPASAPPAPGADDPYTPGQNILDQTVTASPEVPGGLEDTPTPVLEMLNVAIPPCVPYPGSDVDPCERRDTWPQLNPYVSVSYEYPQPVPTLEELYLSIIDTEQYNSAPQFVVRAIPIPGSTRCGTFSSFGSEFTAFSGNREGASDHTRCWVDLAVNEYIINSGPARLTIDIGVWIPNLDRERLANDARVFGERFEGWEWVITLNGPIDPNNASWRMRWHQDVQKREDGSVVVVSWSKKDYMLISPPEFRSINLQRLETTLPEYRRIAKSAYEKFFERTGGRIMVGNDINGNPLPHLAKDASDDSIRKYIGEIKVVDASQYTLNWPPPVPGEGDPNPDGLRINDIIATRVAGGIRIPGGLEDTSTPVSALGDEPTATATAPTPESEESDE